MVHLDVVRTRNAALAQSQPLVAVFVGGTAGIGSYAARALAAHANGGKGLRLYIVGRNSAAADKITADCRAACPAGRFRFVPTDDLALLRNVDRVCAEILRLEQEASTTGERPRIDLLVMTHAYLALEARKETEEGLDMLMSLLYYSRMRFITRLLPLLLASPLPARVVSVFGPQRNDKIFTDDISLRSPKNYGFMNMGSHVAYLTTFFMEQLAAKHAGQLSLVHHFPGLVMTKSLYDERRLPRWLRYTWKFVLLPLSPLISVPREESGERVLFLASSRFPPRGTAEVAQGAGDGEAAVSSDGVVGGGAYRIDWNGEVMPMKKTYARLREEGMLERSWAHTMQAFEDIEAGRVFTG